VGRGTLEEAGKAPRGGGSEYIGWHGKVEGSGGRYSSVQVASLAWRLETCWRDGRVLKGDESALDESADDEE